MKQNKTSQEMKRSRSKSLTPRQIAELVKIWNQHTYDELAVNFGVSKSSIINAGDEIREQNPDLCPKKEMTLKHRVSMGLAIFSELARGATDPEQGQEMIKGPWVT